MTPKLILQRLHEAVSGTEKKYFTKKELMKFAEEHQSMFFNFTKGDTIAEYFTDYYWEKPIRRCSFCGRLMNAGYCVDMGLKYYCSDECLHIEFTDEQWKEECENNDQSYYTEWI